MPSSEKSTEYVMPFIAKNGSYINYKNTNKKV